MATDFADLPTFAYNQLAAHEIRVLVPDASNPETGYSWLLETVSLHDPNLRFNAMSYAWGSQAETFLISCGGCQLQIHHNLYSALPYLAQRYKAEGLVARPYWIDAICINQADGEEKTSQIRLMNEIYRQADKVLVWLGCAPKQEFVPRAIDLLPLVGKELVRYLQSPAHRFEVAHELTHLGRDGWEAILHLLRNPYFRRVWMIQEVALAKEIMFLCGSHEIDAQLMEKAVFASCNLRDFVIYDLNGELMRVLAPSHDDNVVFLIRDIVQTGFEPQNAGDNAHQTIRIANLLSNQTCFAPQDRVLGMLGMVQEEFGDASMELHTYTSIPDLYTRFSTFMLAASGPDKTELHWWFYLSMAFGFKRTDGLPSWVPDLHYQDIEFKSQPYESMVSIRARNGSPWQASARPCVVSKGSQPDEMVLRGKLLDEVALVHPEVPCFPKEGTPGYGDGMAWLAVVADCIRWESKVAEMAKSNTSCETTEPVGDAPAYKRVSEDTYWRTLLADICIQFWSDELLTRETWLQFREIGKRFLDMVPKLEEIKRCVGNNAESVFIESSSSNATFRRTGQDPWLLPDWTEDEEERAVMEIFRKTDGPVYGFVATLCFTGGHQLFNTKDGMFGFTIKGVQPGDVVCVFNHSISPHVLRRVEDRNGEARYIFVGDAYVHGLMRGEADAMGVEEKDIVLV
jgi:hypothetical protein